MKKYECIKIVEAAKIESISFRNENATIATDEGILKVEDYLTKFKGSEEDLGYFVRYANGYCSWSPTKVFEEGYVEVQEVEPPIGECDLAKQNQDFGWALRELKLGGRVRRRGWNGKGMFLFLLPAGDNISTTVIHDPSLRKVIEEETGRDTFDALGSIRMWTADKKVLTGWLASQTDMLSEDWERAE